jgi:hypothetical protein
MENVKKPARLTDEKLALLVKQGNEKALIVLWNRMKKRAWYFSAKMIFTDRARVSSRMDDLMALCWKCCMAYHVSHVRFATYYCEAVKRYSINAIRDYYGINNDRFKMRDFSSLPVNVNNILIRPVEQPIHIIMRREFYENVRAELNKRHAMAWEIFKLKVFDDRPLRQRFPNEYKMGQHHIAIGKMLKMHPVVVSKVWCSVVLPVCMEQAEKCLNGVENKWR